MQCRAVIINQFVCLAGRVRSGDSSGSYAQYGGPIRLQLPPECHNGVRHMNYALKKAVSHRCHRARVVGAPRTTKRGTAAGGMG